MEVLAIFYILQQIPLAVGKQYTYYLKCKAKNMFTSIFLEDRENKLAVPRKYFKRFIHSHIIFIPEAFKKFKKGERKEDIIAWCYKAVTQCFLWVGTAEIYDCVSFGCAWQFNCNAFIFPVNSISTTHYFLIKQ